MKRKIIALLEVDDDTAFQKIDDGPIPYLEKEMGWLEQSNIFLKDAFIADEDENDEEQAYQELCIVFWRCIKKFRV